MGVSAGTRLGPYEITAFIGAGGMGEVYRARDTRLGRDIALKVLPESVRRDEAALARFEREARAVGALSHPNIVAIHDVGRLRLEGASASHGEEVEFLVMELLEGETLRARLQRARSSPRSNDSPVRRGGSATLLLAGRPRSCRPSSRSAETARPAAHIFGPPCPR